MGNKNSNYVAYALIGGTLLAGAIYGGVSLYQDCKRTTAQAEKAIEIKDYATARELLRKNNLEIKEGSLIVPLSTGTESKLKKMLEGENRTK
jgi:hypothetical protein